MTAPKKKYSLKFGSQDQRTTKEKDEIGDFKNLTNVIIRQFKAFVKRFGTKLIKDVGTSISKFIVNKGSILLYNDSFHGFDYLAYSLNKEYPSNIPSNSEAVYAYTKANIKVNDFNLRTNYQPETLQDGNFKFITFKREVLGGGFTLNLLIYYNDDLIETREVLNFPDSGDYYIHSSMIMSGSGATRKFNLIIFYYIIPTTVYSWQVLTYTLDDGDFNSNNLYTDVAVFNAGFFLPGQYFCYDSVRDQYVIFNGPSYISLDANDLTIPIYHEIYPEPNSGTIPPVTDRKPLRDVFYHADSGKILTLWQFGAIYVYTPSATNGKWDYFETFQFSTPNFPSSLSYDSTSLNQNFVENGYFLQGETASEVWLFVTWSAYNTMLNGQDTENTTQVAVSNNVYDSVVTNYKATVDPSFSLGNPISYIRGYSLQWKPIKFDFSIAVLPGINYAYYIPVRAVPRRSPLYPYFRFHLFYWNELQQGFLNVLSSPNFYPGYFGYDVFTGYQQDYALGNFYYSVLLDDGEGAYISELIITFNDELESMKWGASEFIHTGRPTLYNGKDEFLPVGIPDRPMVIGHKVGAAGSGPPTGDKQYYAVFEYTDFSGKIIISMASFNYLYNKVGNTKDIIVIPCPFSYQFNTSAVYNGVFKEVNVKLYRNTPTGIFFVSSKLISMDIIETLTDLEFIDDYTDDSIEDNEPLYIWEGILDYFHPPSSNIATKYKERIFLVSTNDNRTIYYSEKFIPGEFPKFHEEFSYVIGTNNIGQIDEVTSLIEMDEKLIIFTRNNIYYLLGDGPDPTLNYNDLSELITISTTVGCTNHKGTVVTNNGVYFISEDGFYLLTRSLQVLFSGQGTYDYDLSKVHAGIVLSKYNEIRWYGDTFTICFNILTSQLSNFDYGSLCARIEDKIIFFNSNDHILVNEQDGFYGDNHYSGETDKPIAMDIETSFIRLQEPENYFRIKRAMVRGEYYGPHVLQAIFKYDYDDVNEDIYQITPAPGVYQFEYHLARQKCESFSVKIKEIPDNTINAGFKLSDLHFEIFGKRTSAVTPDSKKVSKL